MPNGIFIKLKPRYSVDGGQTWLIPDITGDTLGIDSLHYKNAMVWHSGADLPGIEIRGVKFKLIPRDNDPHNDGTPGISNNIIIDNNYEPVVTIPPIIGEVKNIVTINYNIFDAENDLSYIQSQYYDKGTKVWKKATVTGDTADLHNGDKTIYWNTDIDLPTGAAVIPFRIIPFDHEQGTIDTVNLVLDNIGICSIQITNNIPQETGGDITLITN